MKIKSNDLQFLCILYLFIIFIFFIYTYILQNEKCNIFRFVSVKYEQILQRVENFTRKGLDRFFLVFKGKLVCSMMYL